MQAKKASESFTIMNELVLPNDTNVFGNLMGGRLMYWMDIAAAISAQRHWYWLTRSDGSFCQSKSPAYQRYDQAVVSRYSTRKLASSPHEMDPLPQYPNCNRSYGFCLADSSHSLEIVR